MEENTFVDNDNGQMGGGNDGAVQGGGSLEQQFANAAGQSVPANGTKDNQQSQSATAPEVGQQQTNQQTGQQEVWDGTKWTLKYRGNDYHPKSRDELLNLAQKGFGYSQAMENFNKSKQNYEQQIQERDKQLAVFRQFQEFAKSNPEFGQKLIELAAQYEGNGVQQTNGAMQAAIPPEFAQKIQTLEERYNAIEAEKYDKMVMQELESLKSKYPGHDWAFDDGVNGDLGKQIMRFALDNGYTNLDHAYRVMMWDHHTANAKADALKSEQNKRMAERQQGIVSNGHSSPPPPQKSGYQPGASYNDLAATMLQEMR